MPRLPRITPSRAAVVLMGCTVVGVLATAALASIPSASGVIHGCYAKKTGALRVINYSKQRCHSGELTLTWYQRGRTGAAGRVGPAGATGATGATGSNGPTGTTGAVGAQGAPGQDGAPGQQGLQGDTGPSGATGANGVGGQDGTTIAVRTRLANAVTTGVPTNTEAIVSLPLSGGTWTQQPSEVDLILPGHITVMDSGPNCTYTGPGFNPPQPPSALLTVSLDGNTLYHIGLRLAPGQSESTNLDGGSTEVVTGSTIDYLFEPESAANHALTAELQVGGAVWNCTGVTLTVTALGVDAATMG
jgi:hypothetical protein